MKWWTETAVTTLLVSVFSLTTSARQTTTESMINVRALKGGGGRDGGLKFGDKCENTEQCDFEGSICDSVLKLCQCIPELPVTNHLDKCGKESSVNESCTFNEQCEQVVFQTECRHGRCMCRFDKVPIANKDGVIECQGLPKPKESPHRVDPTMIGILAGMVLMFIILCVVLRLFSKARWSENRSIFNTPNPRLMNASLLQHNKSVHEGRRGSRTSGRGPSRATSVNSLRPHSPTTSTGSRNGGSVSLSNSRGGGVGSPQERSSIKEEDVSSPTESARVESQPLREYV